MLPLLTGEGVLCVILEEHCLHWAPKTLSVIDFLTMVWK